MRDRVTGAEDVCVTRSAFAKAQTKHAIYRHSESERD